MSLFRSLAIVSITSAAVASPMVAVYDRYPLVSFSTELQPLSADAPATLGSLVANCAMVAGTLPMETHTYGLALLDDEVVPLSFDMSAYNFDHSSNSSDIADSESIVDSEPFFLGTLTAITLLPGQ